MALRDIFSGLPSKKGILGINARNLDLIYTHNPRRCFPNVDDKLKCKALLEKAGVPVPRTYHVVDGPRALKTWKDSIAGVSAFVLKPNTGFGGNGIMLVRQTDTGFSARGEEISAQDIEFHLMQILNGAFSLDNVADTAYLEEMLVNHPGLDPFMSDGVEGVGDIRLIYKLDRPVMGMVRLPTTESGGRANLHQGGIGVGIDLSTGVSVGGCHHGGAIDVHPESGRSLAGIPVPYFDKMLEYGARISDVVGLGYIGVDFVCDARYGPLVLEVNARPGLAIQIANKAGIRSRI
ncbi:MAG: alpha-L-glutamate ligase-like protein [candidate division Zixibacteria bacterium]|nr:alpha-L-glutamate ligase-like protein [candidate division Zixibacteria bacterium]